MKQRTLIIAFIAYFVLIPMACDSESAAPVFHYRELPSSYSGEEELHNATRIDTMLFSDRYSAIRVHYDEIALFVDSIMIRKPGYSYVNLKKQQVTMVGFILIDDKEINEIVNKVGYTSVIRDTFFYKLPMATPDTSYFVFSDTTYTDWYRNEIKKVSFRITYSNSPPNVAFSKFGKVYRYGR
jgi:hypothetical protein